MRGGINPAKFEPELTGYLGHRVIVPVYIPSFEGYFAQAHEILVLCLDSLCATTRGRADVTVIANGCIDDVVATLRRYVADGSIDQLVVNRTNRGKVDAVMSAARAAAEDLLTIADCDVLFMPGWCEEVEGVFRAFPECGFASPVPSAGAHWAHTSSTVLEALVRRELRFEKIVADEDLDRHARSIGMPDIYSADDRRAQMVVRRNGAVACVGSGHFVFTTRRRVIAHAPDVSSLMPISGRSEERWLDSPADRLGCWRLATPRAYAYHMGNVPEPWMHDALAAILSADEPVGAQRPIPPLRRGFLRWLPWSVRVRLLSAFRKTGVYRPLVPSLAHGEAKS